MGVEAKLSYRKFLKSDWWINFRLQTLVRRGTECEICGEDNISNDVHHHFYPKSWKETKTRHVVILCRDCHELTHEEHVFKKDPKNTSSRSYRRFKLFRKRVIILVLLMVAKSKLPTPAPIIKETAIRNLKKCVFCRSEKCEPRDWPKTLKNPKNRITLCEFCNFSFKMTQLVYPVKDWKDIRKILPLYQEKITIDNPVNFFKHLFIVKDWLPEKGGVCDAPSFREALLGH